MVQSLTSAKSKFLSLGYDGRLESGHSYGYAWEVDSSGNKVPHTQEHYSGLQVSDDYWTK
jgi:hypothetical protein